MRDYVVPGKAYLVYKEFPLPMHNHSKEAAVYACASARVGKYEQVADALFRNQPAWAGDGKVFETVSSALSPAEQKKVQDLAKDPTILNEVQQDLQEGQFLRTPVGKGGCSLPKGSRRPFRRTTAGAEVSSQG